VLPRSTHSLASAQELDLSADRLSDRIQRLANREIDRVDFMRRVTQRVREFFSCTAVEVMVEEDRACARFRAGVGIPSGFDLQLIECPRTRGVVTEGTPLCHLAPELEQRCASAGGRFWVGEQLPACDARGCEPPMESRDVRSVALLPLSVAGDVVGWLLLYSGEIGFFFRRQLESFCRVGETLGVAVVNQRTQAALRERVKELTGLYAISRLAEQPGISLEQLLQGIAEVLPPAWQYPDIAVGRIVLDDRSYATTGDANAVRDRQRAEIMVSGERRGYVEVAYTRERPRLAEGPFLREERNLLDAIAREVAAVIERRQAAQEGTRLKEQLRHADRLATIGQLAAGVAHELNEPLGAVLGFAQLAGKVPELPDLAANDLRKIEAASLHAREIVKKLMFFARQTPPRTTIVNLNQIVDEGLYFLENRWSRKGITLERHLGHDLPEITADVAQLQQVLVNLVVNAEHAMPDGGRLTIVTESRGNRVALMVEDTGTGMSDEIRDQVFLPFFTTKDVNEGTGLGLAVVHGIVTSHGGTIHVRSGEGEGSCFEIELPIGRPAVAEAAVSEGETGG